MKISAPGFEEVKKLVFQFPPEDKLQLLKELEKDVFQQRVDNLLAELKDVPLTYDEIQREEEYVRQQRNRV